MARIGIVGAGPGGISLARILRERGFEDVVVWERAERVGGKSYTVDYGGLRHEMGTCYTATGYTHLKRWMKEAGIDLYRLTRHKIVKADGEVVDFKDFVTGPSTPRAWLQVGRYILRWLSFWWRERTRGGQKGWDTEVSQDFRSWLRAGGFDVIERFSYRTMTCMGYGACEVVPALNGLRWNTPSLVAAAELMDVHEPVQGYMYLWMHLAKTMDVRLNTPIRRADRQDGRWVVTTDAGLEVVDHLVVTGAVDEARWLDLPEDTQAAFAPIEWHRYATSLVHAEGWFRDTDTRSFEKNILGAAGDRRGHLLVARRTGDKVPGLSQNRPDVYVCYQYGGDAELPLDVLQQKLREDIAAEGGRVVEVITQAAWKYCPTLARPAIADGGVWRIEEVQGRDNLWFAGASVCHESADNIVDYNERLVYRMRDAIEGRTPSWFTRMGRILGRLRDEL
jgi:glycine/D-amino acid oxidase-like deaminating enzyme